MTSKDVLFYTCAVKPGHAAGISRSYMHVPENGSSLVQRATNYAKAKALHARIGGEIERARRLPN